MPLKARCPKCKSTLGVTSKMAGKKGRCPKCAAVFKVPTSLRDKTASKSATSSFDGPADKPASQPLQRSNANRRSLLPARNPKYRQQLLEALQQPIPPVRKSIFYALALFIVTLVMVVLPVVYLAFIGLIGFSVYWHLMNNQWLLSLSVGLRGRVLMGIAYVAPLVVGLIAVLFMFKPLLARPARRPRTRSLTRNAEPLLFEFVEAICAAVGAPEPARID